MDGISTRTGGEGGSHDPTGKLMTSVERVGPALAACAMAEPQTAGGRGRLLHTLSAGPAAGAPGRAGEPCSATPGGPCLPWS